MKFKKSFLFASVLLFAFHAKGNDLNQQVTGLGVFDCGQWIKQQHFRGVHKSWLLGYLSGLNARGLQGARTRKTIDLLAGVSPEQIELLVDKYCMENPLSSLIAAAHNVADTLIARK
jgi:hypothetical protein